MMRRNARMKRDVFLADIGTRPLTMGILSHDGLIFRRRPLHCRRRVQIFILFRAVVHDHDGFLGSLTGDGVEGTLVGSLTASLSAITAGAAILRVHDVEEHAVALRVLRAKRGT